VCGIVMPISEIDGCPAAHWVEVRDILEASIKQAGFEPRLVSDADEVDVIHKRIIENLCKDPISSAMAAARTRTSCSNSVCVLPLISRQLSSRMGSHPIHSIPLQLNT
jgi:hypothetical protein